MTAGATGPPSGLPLGPLAPSRQPTAGDNGLSSTRCAVVPCVRGGPMRSVCRGAGACPSPSSRAPAGRITSSPLSSGLSSVHLDLSGRWACGGYSSCARRKQVWRDVQGADRERGDGGWVLRCISTDIKRGVRSRLVPYLSLAMRPYDYLYPFSEESDAAVLGLGPAPYRAVQRALGRMAMDEGAGLSHAEAMQLIHQFVDAVVRVVRRGHLLARRFAHAFADRLLRGAGRHQLLDLGNPRGRGSVNPVRVGRTARFPPPPPTA